MNRVSAYARTRVLALLVIPSLLAISLPAAAEEVLRIVTLTATSAEAQQKGLDAVSTDVRKLYKAAKGCESVTFFADPTALATGSVSLWSSREDLDAFLKSAPYKAILERLKPFMKGPPETKIYKVNAPK